MAKQRKCGAAVDHYLDVVTLYSTVTSFQFPLLSKPSNFVLCVLYYLLFGLWTTGL